MPVVGVAKFQRLFRKAAGTDVDKNDLKRYNDFINDKIYDLFLLGQAHAKSNGRDIIQPHDLPITKGLQESIHDFKELDEEIELQPLLDHLTAQPVLEISFSEATRSALPAIAGGLSVALARTFKIIDPEVKNPRSEHWERIFRIFRLLL
jgi:hypothetical protein